MLLGEQLYGVVPLGTGEDVPGGGTFTLATPATVAVTITLGVGEVIDQPPGVIPLEVKLITAVVTLGAGEIGGGAPQISLQTQTKYVTTAFGAGEVVDRNLFTPDTLVVNLTFGAEEVAGGDVVVGPASTLVVTTTLGAGELASVTYDCTDLFPIALWPGYSSDGTSISFALTDLVNLSSADADATTGDWQEVVRAILQTSSRCLAVQGVNTELDTMLAYDKLVWVDDTGQRLMRNVQKFIIEPPCYNPVEE